MNPHRTIKGISHVAITVVALGVSACGANNKPSPSPTVTTSQSSTTQVTITPRASATPTSSNSKGRPPLPALTGFGAALAEWNTAHTLDSSAPAGNAYLPQTTIGGQADDTWQLVTAPDGHVNSYTVNVASTTFAAALSRARQELPSDAKMLWSAQLGSCYEAEFDSPMVPATLDDGMVNVSFDNAITASSTPITEELFGTFDAPTEAQAPAC